MDGRREGGMDVCAEGGSNNEMHFKKHAEVTWILTLCQDAKDE